MPTSIVSRSQLRQRGKVSYDFFLLTFFFFLVFMFKKGISVDLIHTCADTGANLNATISSFSVSSESKLNAAEMSMR